jgi:hypothetical protein
MGRQPLRYLFFSAKAGGAAAAGGRGGASGGSAPHRIEGNSLGGFEEQGD